MSHVVRSKPSNRDGRDPLGGQEHKILGLFFCFRLEIYPWSDETKLDQTHTLRRDDESEGKHHVILTMIKLSFSSEISGKSVSGSGIASLLTASTLRA